MDRYIQTRSRLEDYFDRTASDTWERLTSDKPVSKIRQTVRAGRDRMRATMLGKLPSDLTGLRILDAGCGAGQASVELAERGADVVAVDISPSLLEVAARRTPDYLKGQITYQAGDMLDPYLGEFDHIIAMDSLIHYNPADIGAALAKMGERCAVSTIFTVAPKTAFLTAFWAMGQVFPRRDRSPQIVPVSDARLARAVSRQKVLSGFTLERVERVNSGFYISQAMELRR